MKNKKTVLIIAVVAALIIVAVAAVVLLKLFADKPDVSEENETEAETLLEVTDINDIVGATASFSDVKAYVYELANGNVDDDFSRAFMGRSTMKIISVNAENNVASVEFCVPDLEKIMRAELPDDLSGDYDALFEKYFSDINAAIADADESDMLTQTIDCQVITDSFGSKISIEGAPILNYQNILAEVLIEALSGSEVTE